MKFTRIGQMTSVITLQQPTKVVSAAGSVSRTWTDSHVNVPAHKTFASGGVTSRGEQVNETVDAVFTIMLCADVGVGWRVKIDDEIQSDCANPTSKIYNVVSVMQYSEQRPVLSLMCSRVEDG